MRQGELATAQNLLSNFSTPSQASNSIITTTQDCLKVHKHEFFYTFFVETETLWSQGPVTRDFKKLYSIRPRYSTFEHFRACSACDEISSMYAQCVIKFVLHMLRLDCTCKNVHILPLAEHAQKFVPRMLSLRWNRFRVCSACDKIVSTYAQHTHAIIFENKKSKFWKTV
jgi:hypothetical protein